MNFWSKLFNGVLLVLVVGATWHCVIQGSMMKHLEEHILQSDMTRKDIMLYYTTVSCITTYLVHTLLPVFISLYSPCYLCLLVCTLLVTCVY